MVQVNVSQDSTLMRKKTWTLMRKKPWSCRWWKFTRTNRLSLFKCNFYFLTHTIQPCVNQVYCLICGWKIYPICLWFIFLLTRGGIFYSTVYSNYVSTTGIKFNSCNMYGCLRGPKKEFFACNFHMPVRVRLGYIKLYFILADF